MTAEKQTRHISVYIDRSPEQVYRFASDLKNLGKWASGLGTSATVKNNEVLADSPMGRIRIKFAEPNKFGVLDHVVTVQSGASFSNPMRVLPNGSGSEVVFTLFRQPDTSDQKFTEDAQWIEKDLKTLKSLLEMAAPLKNPAAR